MSRDNEVSILECTLRDGSYAIDYQFTAEDTAVIALGLEHAGFRLIEIGHGLGMDASAPSIGVAAASDEEYLLAASSVLSKASFGMFFIPGIGRIESLEMAARHGMGFVRVGTNVTEIENARPYIERAKELGMTVSSNLMKSYALPVDEFIKKVQLAVSYGADVICVVDSAGGMMPEEVREYVVRTLDAVDVIVGFHGHNNLDLAVANSIAAVQAGARVVDASLQGMGRSAGNAQTELLVLLLDRLGYEVGVDPYRTMDIGEKLIRPVCGHGVDSVAAVMGYAQFHSSYLSTVERVADQFGLDVRELIARVSEVDRVNIDQDLAERVAAAMLEEDTPSPGIDVRSTSPLYLSGTPSATANDTVEESARQAATDMVSLARKFGKRMVFTIAGSWKGSRARFPFIRQDLGYVIGNAEVPDAEQAVAVARAVDGLVDYVFVDTSVRDGVSAGMADAVRMAVQASEVFTYDDVDVQIDAVASVLEELSRDRVRPMAVHVLGSGTLAEGLVSRLRGRGLETSTGAALVRDAVILVGADPRDAVVDESHVASLSEDAIVVDAGPGSLVPGAIELAHDRGIEVLRVDMRAALSSAIVRALETSVLVRHVMGSGEIDGVRVVAGGVVGRRGDVIIDSIESPTTVIGIADGKGGVLSSEDAVPFAHETLLVRRAIAYALFRQ